MATQTQATRQAETRRQILKSAEQIFAREGFAGARMDEIARVAKVNKAMIYYHIGNKRELYAAVLHHIFSNAIDRFRASIQQAETPKEKLRQYLRNIIQTISQNPGAAAILIREQATGGADFPDVIIKDMSEIIMMLVEILDQGYQQGIFRESNPFAVHMLAIGSILLTHTSYPIRLRFPIEPPEIERQKKQPIEITLKDIETLILNAVLKTR